MPGRSPPSGDDARTATRQKPLPGRDRRAGDCQAEPDGRDLASRILDSRPASWTDRGPSLRSDRRVVGRDRGRYPSVGLSFG